jgi:hypothetical protein
MDSNDLLDWQGFAGLLAGLAVGLLGYLAIRRDSRRIPQMPEPPRPIAEPRLQLPA